MNNKAIALYLHVHQPFRIRHYTVFDIAAKSDYFEAPQGSKQNNADLIHKVAQKSYLPTNKLLLELLRKYPEFKLSLSISGTVLAQMRQYAPHVLESFQELAATGRVEIVGETYHHSLAFFYSLAEFESQVQMHKELIQTLFNQTPRAFRNTELAYNNDLALWAERAGYSSVLAEGWDPILGWRSPNFVYKPVNTDSLRLLMKNYKLSDDIAFRFGDPSWAEWPLTSDKFTHWLNESGRAQTFNLFMDYETFGEHQWGESGIFEFMRHLPGEWLNQAGNAFMTVSEAASFFEPVDSIDTPHTTTWADTERDLSAWLGNPMQQQAIQALYSLQESVMQTNDWSLIEDWRRLQTSDHFYYMCVKWFNDGDIHAYFSPYDSPYEAYMNFMNAWHDLKRRLLEKGEEK